jgi:hypothetical protein
MGTTSLEQFVTQTNMNRPKTPPTGLRLKHHLQASKQSEQNMKLSERVKIPIELDKKEAEKDKKPLNRF